MVSPSAFGNSYKEVEAKLGICIFKVFSREVGGVQLKKEFC
jgi:hypothetical protein